MNSIKGRKCPKEVRRAVKAYAKAVKLVSELCEMPFADPQTEYHGIEYIDEMETLLLHQLLTSMQTNRERDAVLSGAGLEHLRTRLHVMAKEWKE